MVILQQPDPVRTAKGVPSEVFSSKFCSAQSANPVQALLVSKVGHTWYLEVSYILDTRVSTEACQD